MKAVRPLILVTNDDGIIAPGIRNLVEIAKEFGEVIVVAPDTPQSAKGHAITIHDIIRVNKVQVFDGVESYSCSGTPVDCVKMAKHTLLKGRQIDLCISGINHGSNASVNIIYSGTMSAAMEASMEGIKAIGFSLCDFSFEADFSAARYYIWKLIGWALNTDMNSCKLLNVNIPKLPFDSIKGIKICRQAEARWQEDFLENKDPNGRNYYWLSGKFVCDDRDNDTDIWALDEGYVSVVPCHHDLTHYGALESYKHVEYNSDEQ
jgi:5'-nucleotidase